ncbi:MAG: hypothetical protein AABY53_04405 [Bdellovibrionota bacterium]
MDHSNTTTFVTLRMKMGRKAPSVILSTSIVYSLFFSIFFLSFFLGADLANAQTAKKPAPPSTTTKPVAPAAKAKAAPTVTTTKATAPAKKQATPKKTTKVVAPVEIKQAPPSTITQPAAPVETNTIKKNVRVPRETKEESQRLKTGLFFWGQTIKLITSDSRIEDIDVKYTGLTLGYEYIQKWTDYSLWFEMMGSLVQGQAASAGTTIVYQKAVTPGVLVLTDAGFAYHPHENVLFGAGIGAFVHQLALELPTSALVTYEFKYSQPIKMFFTFKLGWYFADDWYFEQKMVSSIEPGIDVGWNLSVGFGF